VFEHLYVRVLRVQTLERLLRQVPLLPLFLDLEPDLLPPGLKGSLTLLLRELLLLLLLELFEVELVLDSLETLHTLVLTRML